MKGIRKTTVVKKKDEGALNGMVPTISNDIQLYKKNKKSTMNISLLMDIKASKNRTTVRKADYSGVLLDHFLHHSRVRLSRNSSRFFQILVHFHQLLPSHFFLVVSYHV